MVLPRVLTTFDYEQYQAIELCVSVVGIVSMCRRLSINQRCHDYFVLDPSQLTQWPFFNIILAKQWAPAARKLGGLPMNRSSMIVSSRKYLANVRVSKS